MATAEDLNVLEDELTCAVCLQLYSDPHLLPCGHNFCLSCLQQLKSQSEQGRLRCPECRQSHHSLGPWQKNLKLASIADGYRSQSQVPSRKAGDVRCDFCPPGAADEAAGSTAVKTCLKCEVSMCPEHLKPHVELPVFCKHPLVEPLGDMNTWKCPEHDEMFRYFCLDESTLLCNACTIEGEHKEHCIKTLKNAMKDLKVSLGKQLRKANGKIRIVEKNMRDQKEVERQNKDFLEKADHQVHVLREALVGRLEGFLSSLQGCAHGLEAEQGLSVQHSLTRIATDRSRLDDAHAGIQQLIQENDPLEFIKEYRSCAKRYRQILRKHLFVPRSTTRDLDSLGESMEGHMEEFLTDLRQHVNTLVDTICTEEERDEGVEEDEDDSNEDNGSEEDGEEEEEEEEMSGDEEDQDDLENSGEDYRSEEDEEDE